MSLKLRFSSVLFLTVIHALASGCSRPIEQPPAPAPSPGSQAQQQEQEPAQSPNRKDPSPGPIIVLTPKDAGGNKLETRWQFEEDESDVPPGDDDKISIRFIGLIYGASGFQVLRTTDAAPINPNEVTMVIKSGQERTLRIRRDIVSSTHYFDWRFSASSSPSPLSVCDDVGDNCIVDCVGRQKTLPSKLFGEIISIKVDGADLSPQQLKWIRIQADVQHPCP